MDGVLCPVVVGRGEELSALTAGVDQAVAGRGRLAVLVGEAGVGKSRLVRSVAEIAADRGLRVLSGRAVPGATPPFRPLTEALLVTGRGNRPPDSPELAGFAGQLARLVPNWGRTEEAGGADESPVLIGEALVRLLRVLGGATGCLLVLEDLHWGDPETLAVVDYLADTLSTERVLCLATARPDRPCAMSELLDRLRSRRVGTVSWLAPLSVHDREQMVAACLSGGTAPAPGEVSAFVGEHSDGLPFLIEELLAGLIASGALVREDGRWRAVHRPTLSIPGSFAESVRTRLAAMDPAGRRVLSAAAVLGRRFDWELLPGTAAVDGPTVVGALRQAVAAQLVAVHEEQFRFRHALTREAVLAELLPPERSELAGRALVAAQRAHPGLPDEWCELAGELAEAAGHRATAAGLAAESARRALRRGALASAEAAATRARLLAPARSAAAVEADEVFVQACAAAGEPGPARAVGEALVGRFDELRWPPARAVPLLLVLARAALAAGDVVEAEADLQRARARADAGEPALLAQLDAVAAHVALAGDRLDEARRLASSAVDRAARAGSPAVECEALEVLGRTAVDLVERHSWFQRAATLAARSGLSTWRLRALQELALSGSDGAGSSALTEVRRMAADAGALVTVAQMDLALADLALATLDRDGCLEAAQRCVAASRRYGLASLPVALLWLAGAHALAGRESEMEAALAEAETLARGSPRILADAWGRVRATSLALREDRSGLRSALDRSMEYTRLAPETESVYPGQVGWALLRAMTDDDLGVSARAEVAGSRVVVQGWGRGVLDLVDAVILGRQGRGEEAHAAAATAHAAMVASGADQWSRYELRLVAEAAVRDHWGEPAGWLREAEAFFAGRGYDRVARECRALLRAAGAPSTRRGRGRSEVPPGLRRLGVTSRELDVLTLIAEGLPTREVAARLFLSPRTVEHHVASLLARTGTRSRTELVEFARANQVAPPP